MERKATVLQFPEPDSFRSWPRKAREKLVMAIFPELADTELPMTPVSREIMQRLQNARAAHLALLEQPPQDALPAAVLLAERLEIDQQVAVLYRSIRGTLEIEPSATGDGAEEIQAACDPIVCALRRLHHWPGIGAVDPLLFEVLRRQSGSPLMLYRLAIEEARLLDAGRDQPDALDCMSRHLFDADLAADVDIDPDSWQLLETQVVIYRGIHRARRLDYEGGSQAIDCVAHRLIPRDPMILSAVAELKALQATAGDSISAVVQPLVLSAILLQDDAELFPRLVELAVLRIDLHHIRGEATLARKTRRWLRSMAHQLDRGCFPELAREIDRVLEAPSAPVFRRMGVLPIIE